GLNHYIGMKTIEPEEIPVLDIMPVGLAVLVVTGLIVAGFGRRWAVWTWLAGFAVAGALALYEFWRWSYDYGHNLDPNAIIKVPGMTYQPPIIGSKQLLNFTAASWPDIGGIAAAVAFAIALAALLIWRRKPVAARSSRAHLVPAVVAASLMFLLPAVSQGQRSDQATVSPTGPVKTISEGLNRVRDGGRLVITAGVYREHGVRVSRPVEIIGEGFPLMDGEGKGELLLITANDVKVTGMRFTGTGVSHVEDRAAIRVTGATGCDISGNRIEEALYGIYLAKVEDCRVAKNELFASGGTESSSGNGIHVWSGRRILITDNLIRGYRDGIYFEFVHDTDVIRNVSERNLRYGLHFMYSDDCTYTSNTFRNNASGVAVMYTNRVHMIANRFEESWGGAAYGLLLKEIADSRLERNVFSRNTIGLVADGANRVQAVGNTFSGNGWAVKVEGSTLDGRFTSNTFTGNTFDVTTNSRRPSSVFEGNYWSEYAGYDLDRDGIGDVPHAPVRLFAVILERNPQAIVLLRSVLVGLIDAAERAMPSLTPRLFVDAKPLMRKPT
ncbi:MAG: nitrous oxide reductase family maturation protein NosD, partial [Gemmatimonadaceae bacterium]